MTKLEERLKELGYKKEIKKGIPMGIYHKYINYFSDKIIIITWLDKKVYEYYLETDRIIKNQQDLENLQQVFKQMENDLEEVKKYV